MKKLFVTGVAAYVAGVAYELGRKTGASNFNWQQLNPVKLAGGHGLNIFRLLGLEDEGKKK